MEDRQQHALALKRALDARFLRKGIATAIISGVCYGLFTTFLNLGLGEGVWAQWAAGAVSVFVLTYVVSAMGSAMMYTASSLWSLALTIAQGKFTDLLRSINTKPGRMIILAALLGGPIAGTLYVIALQKAGSIVIPITALNPAIGAILARIFYKQALTPRMLLGIGVCFASSVMIGASSLGADAPEGMFAGVVLAFLAAIGWGLEGTIAGYSTAIIDYQIGITIRQFIAGVSNLIIVLPLLGVVAGEGWGYSWQLFGQALTDGASLPAFIASGFFALFAYSLWYKGNSMCGAALGMACNSAYSFWGPFFCWIVLGVICGKSGWTIPAIGWLSAVVMVLGIFIIAVDPRTLFKKGGRAQ
ncbi:MAG: hypothetical protein Q4C56_07320 [Peptococcaceae bacterium]|nr:hypothetical protein [Peptococcaceae bacterium]